ncbi:helix-turn-helix domain-containing protein [Amycolatopsis azurea]|uniref:helix-turn-helix domain-containing protein n=1 Tax=Amycolatopsis azurea TaxID=36819 RepID=UPI003805B4A8
MLRSYNTMMSLPGGPSDQVQAAAIAGQHLRACRRSRGLSLRTAAQLAGLSSSFLSMVENGQRTLSRWSDALALASALRMSPQDILGETVLAALGEADPVAAAIPAVRLAIAIPGRVHSTPPLEQLNAQVDHLIDLADQRRYHLVLKELPTALTALTQAARDRDVSRRESLRLQIRFYGFVCARVLLETRYVDLAGVAVDRLEHLAHEVGDPVQIAIAGYWRVSLTMALESYKNVVQTAQQVAAALPMGRHGESEHVVLGSLHLVSAYAEATERQDAEAMALLGIATEHFARNTAPTLRRHLCRVCDTDVNRLEVLGLLGRYDEAIRTGGNITLPPGSTCATAAIHHTVMACCLSQFRHRGADAVRHLTAAEQSTPGRLRFSLLAKQAVADLLTTEPQGQIGRELRGLAYHNGLIPRAKDATVT